MSDKGKCKICNSKIEMTEKNKIEGTDFVIYGYVCDECRRHYSNERIAELLNMPGVVKIR